MAKSKKDVKFQHRGSQSSSRHRRSSSQALSLSSESENNQANGSSVTTKDEQRPKSDFEKKKQTFITRLIWTVVMVLGFIGALLSGHIYIIILISAIQIISFKEVVSIIDVPSRARSLRFTKSLNWYFLGTAMYFLYGESVIYYFKHVVLIDKIFLPFATHHRFISFMLYIFGFVFFVGSLQKGHYRFQFTQVAWTHIALYLIVVQAHFVMNNIFEGLIWFLLPACLVIINDIMAYVCGITFGRTQLIKLSPKKTVEGFVGAWIFTIIFGFGIANWLAKYTYFTCPVNDLGANFWSGLECKVNPIFITQTYEIPFTTPAYYNIAPTFDIKPFQLHIFFLATFASLIAPFGGFFASGIKRTFHIKDFGDSIPGHGGITDRFDCQFIMGTLTFMYYQGFIAVHNATVGGVIEMAMQGLTIEDQMEVIKGLSKHLANQGVLPYSVS
jgi:phosphatidate cytidylyltransferase